MSEYINFVGYEDFQERPNFYERPSHQPSNKKCLVCLRDGRQCGMPATMSISGDAWICPIHYKVEHLGLSTLEALDEVYKQKRFKWFDENFYNRYKQRLGIVNSYEFD